MAGNEIERPYERGLSCTEIAGIVGSGGNSVYNHLKAAGTRMRFRSEADKRFPRPGRRTLYNPALSASQIGHPLGVHPTTVVKRLRSCGLLMRPKRTASAIGYSAEEFRSFFFTSEFLDTLSRLADA